MLNAILLNGVFLSSPVDAVAMVPESYPMVMAISNLMSTDVDEHRSTMTVRC